MLCLVAPFQSYSYDAKPEEEYPPGFILDQLNSQSTPEEDRTEQLLWSGMIYNTCVNWVKDGMKKSVDEMMDHIKNAFSSIAQKVSK